MKQSIFHLPKNKQDELQKMVEVIRQNCADVEKIILFGSYARGNYKEDKDIKDDRKSGHISDYDILVVTEKKETALDTMLWSKIFDLCYELQLSATPRILTHDIEELNIKLSEGQYFYTDIRREGILLYDSKKFNLAEMRELSAREKQRIAGDHFEHWFGRAKIFLEDFNSNFQKFKNDQKYSGIAAFYLHQAAEHAYKTIHLVFTNYLPKEHFLLKLSEKIISYHSEFAKLFPQNTREEKDRFKLFEYAYIGGRYDPKYYISKEDLEILAKDVARLLTITEEICGKKIQSFTK